MRERDAVFINKWKFLKKKNLHLRPEHEQVIKAKLLKNC